MVKVKKSIKKPSHAPSDITAFVDQIIAVPEDELADILRTLIVWRYSRGDLYNWTSVLDRFDDILAAIITSYDLNTPQTSDFTPKTKGLILEILRIQRLLLENCNNRKAFASYDRLYDLLLTNDLDILESSLFTLLRPTQQYTTQTPFEPGQTAAIIQRVFTLARAWERSQAGEVDLARLASDQVLSGSASVQSTYYPTSSSNSKTVTFDLVPGVCDKLAKVAEETHMPREEQFNTLNRIRVQMAMNDTTQRQQLLRIRLLALATYANLATDDVAQSSIFLYEPDLVTQLARLLPRYDDMGRCALLAIDACANHRAKLPEALSAMSVNVSHGVLMSLLRGVIERLDTNTVPDSLMDAIFAFIARIVNSSGPNGQLLVSAGLLPLLLSMLATSSSRRDNYVPRAAGLLDNVIYAIPQALPNFSSIDGISTLVARIRAEIDNYDERPFEPMVTATEESIQFIASAPLRAVLRTVHRLMQQTGGGDGLRNLVDSDLPKSLKLIFESSSRAGSRVYAAAINIMATFVHNEPTSLTVIQEQQLPQALFTSLEKEIPTSADVMSAVSNAIGAICLNQTGTDFVKQHPAVIINLVRVATTPKQEEITGERDSAQHLGGSLDELVRHHPQLKEIVLGAVQDVIQAVLVDAAACTKEEEGLPKLNKIFKLLQGLVRNGSMCQVFLEDGTLDRIIATVDHSYIPHQYIGRSDTAATLTNLLRVFGEHDHVKLANHLVKAIRAGLASCPRLWQVESSGQSWTTLAAGEDSSELNAELASLRGLTTRISLYSEVALALAWTHPRIATAFIKAWDVRSDAAVIADLGKLHRACFVQHAKLKSTKKPVPADSTTTSETSPADTAETTLQSAASSDSPEPPMAIDAEDPSSDVFKDYPVKATATRCHATLMRLFKTMIKLLFHKRSTDAVHRQEASALADAISDVIKNHLEVAGENAKVCAVTLGLVTILLFDDRGHEGHFNAILYMAFEAKGGLKLLLSNIQQTLDKITSGAFETYVGRFAVMLLSALASPRALVENAQMYVVQRDHPDFSPLEHFIRLRLAVLPLVLQVWNAVWLNTAPKQLVKATSKTLLSIMEAKSEEPGQTATSGQIGVPAPPRPPVVADPARITQLVDMGFPRDASEFALLRSRNNVAAAADLILSMPHLFQNELPAEDQLVDDAHGAPALTIGTVGEAGVPGALPEAPGIDTREGDATDGAQEAQSGNSADRIDTASTAAAMEVDPGPSAKAQLDQLRSTLRPDLPTRALALVDCTDDLVFDILPAFPATPEGVSMLFNATAEKVRDYDGGMESTVASRLQLLAVYLRSQPHLLPSSADLTVGVNVIVSLPSDVEYSARWLPAMLLLSESLLIWSTIISKAKLGDGSVEIVEEHEAFDILSSRLAPLCRAMLAHSETSQETLVSVMRVLVIITRKSHAESSAMAALAAFNNSPGKLIGCQPLLAILLRHAFEMHDTLESTIRYEIREWLTPTRNDVTDVTYFVRQLRQIAARDPAIFVASVEKECTLVEPSPPQSVFHIRGRKDVATSVPTDPFIDGGARHKVMEHLVDELDRVCQGADKSTALQDHSRLIMASITELVGSYISGKKAFMAAIARPGVFSKSRSGLSALINDIIGHVHLQQDLDSSMQPSWRKTHSSRAITMVVALCSDVGNTAKGVSEDVVSIRRTVLDVITKIVKDTTASDLYYRYGRLWAIGELIQRLLMAKVSLAPSNGDTTSLHIAKSMLEKNYVHLLTNALGELDLGFPGVRVVLISLLKAMDHLSKLSVKWGKTDKKSAQTAAEVVEDELDSTSESEMDVSDDEQEAPDLYRNSALGLMGNDLGDDEDEEDEETDDEDDGMMEVYDDEMMDHEMDDDEDTGTSSEGSEDDNMEGGEWTDEDEEMHELDDETEEEQDPDIEDGLEIRVGDENDDEAGWNEEDEEDEHETDDEDGLHDEYAEEGFYVNEDEDDDEIMNENDYEDELDIITRFPNRPEDVRTSIGAWGWEQTTPQPGVRTHQRPSRLFDEGPAATALFGSQPPPQLTMEHPLLVRPPAETSLTRHIPHGLGTLNDLMASLEGMGGAHAVHMLERILARTGMRDDAIRISVNHDDNGAIALSVGGQTLNIPQTPSRSLAQANTNPSAEFVPKVTSQRWQEEMAITPGIANDNSHSLVFHIINRLLPDARRAAEEEAARLKEEEEADGTKSVSIVVDDHTDKGPEQTASERTAVPSEDIDMSGISAFISPVTNSQPNVADPDVGAVVDEPIITLARTLITIHGREVDITDTGIDLEFLQALPDEMRADVVEQHMREQTRARPPTTSNTEGSSQLNADFLNALPPDIRAEVIMQQAMDNARDGSRSTHTVAPPAGRVPQGHNAPTADMLVGLGNDLRDVLLAGANGRNTTTSNARHDTDKTTKLQAKRPRREAVQLLDKVGIASLVRLLFFPEALNQGYLFHILINLCENSSSRSDLLGFLLRIVHDGSGDFPAVDRSFQQMTLRGVPTPKSTSKSKVIEPPAPLTTANIFAHLQTEHIPTFIAQRCFDALARIVTANPRAVTYFLVEQEEPFGLRKATRKGKGKEKYSPSTKYPIVILISLFERHVLLNAPGIMESLSGLLAIITKPLINHKVPLAETKVTSATAVDSTALPSPGVETSATSTTPARVANSDEPSLPVHTSSGLESSPVIPASVFRLVANALTIGECTSKTFSQTLTIMQNLTYLPEGKDAILLDLQARAQRLGSALRDELQHLHAAIRNEEVDIGPITASAFSPPSSSQAQLLRLLKTIDYLHLGKIDSDLSAETATSEERAVSGIYASLDFDTMWGDLGDCLSLVESHGRTEHLATVLLPLVESLMVVCKFRARATRASRSPSAPPASPDEPTDLFVTFTTAHRTVLNSIVRNNPALLSGSFSLLVRNSRVLDFDNKRNWFFQKLKSKRDKVPSGLVSLNVRRKHVFEDSFKALHVRTDEEVKYGKLSVKFQHEDGVDAGGVTREWYSVLAQQIFDPNFVLFEPCAADHQTFQPNKASAINGELLAYSYFKFVGRVIGKAVYDGRLLDAYFNRAFYKQILGRTVDIRDLESVDPEYHKSLQWMLDNDITGVIDQEFTIEDDEFGEKKVVELKEGGASVPVTEENKAEYVKLVVSYRLDNSIKNQIKAFLEGFYGIIPQQLVQIFEPDQLELLISGITKIDVDELKNATQLSGWKSTDPEIAWFWRALRSFSQEERSRFLMFVTSSSRVPLGGFTQLQGSSGIQPFQIQKLYGKDGSLPQASTCFNLLLLPSYSSYEQLRERVQFAVVETGGFGKA